MSPIQNDAEKARYEQLTQQNGKTPEEAMRIVEEERANTTQGPANGNDTATSDGDGDGRTDSGAPEDPQSTAEQAGNPGDGQRHHPEAEVIDPTTVNPAPAGEAYTGTEAGHTGSPKPADDQ